MRVQNQKAGAFQASELNRASSGPVVVIRRGPRDPGRIKRQGVTSWFIAFEPLSERKFDPLEGWTTTYDAFSSINIEFQKLEDAVACIEARGWRYRLYD